MFKPMFPEPQRFAAKVDVVPGLTGGGKMSKSVEGSYILLADDLKTIKARLAKAPTDSGRGKKLPQKGGVANLLALVEMFVGKKARQTYEKQYLGKGVKYSELKSALAEAIHRELEPIQKRRRYFETHPKEADRILEEGREYCSKIAKATLMEVRRAMGLV
jgi:tryptophanyl-tRNA synthetase